MWTGLFHRDDERVLARVKLSGCSLSRVGVRGIVRGEYMLSIDICVLSIFLSFETFRLADELWRMRILRKNIFKIVSLIGIFLTFLLLHAIYRDYYKLKYNVLSREVIDNKYNHGIQDVISKSGQDITQMERSKSNDDLNTFVSNEDIFIKNDEKLSHYDNANINTTVHNRTIVKPLEFFQMHKKKRINLTKITSNPITSRKTDDEIRSNNVTHFNHPVCYTNKFDEIELLMLITSHPLSFDRRDAIRQTWASISESNRSKVRHLFVLGAVGNVTNTNRTIEMENVIYGDIIQGNFTDTYTNLTLKTLLSLKWALRYCNNTKYVIKVDDDVWLNVPKLLNLLLVEGHRLENAVGGLVISSFNNKTHGQRKTSAMTNVYPPFCSGTAYVTTMTTVRHIVNISLKVPLFHLEDVYIGLCLKALHFNVINFDGFNKHKVPLNSCVYKKRIITGHWVSPDEMFVIWRRPVHHRC